MVESTEINEDNAAIKRMVDSYLSDVQQLSATVRNLNYDAAMVQVYLDEQSDLVRRQTQIELLPEYPLRYEMFLASDCLVGIEKVLLEYSRRLAEAKAPDEHTTMVTFRAVSPANEDAVRTPDRGRNRKVQFKSPIGSQSDRRARSMDQQRQENRHRNLTRLRITDLLDRVEGHLDIDPPPLEIEAHVAPVVDNQASVVPVSASDVWASMLADMGELRNEAAQPQVEDVARMPPPREGQDSDGDSEDSSLERTIQVLNTMKDDDSFSLSSKTSHDSDSI
jgi:hypothetical protein